MAIYTLSRTQIIPKSISAEYTFDIYPENPTIFFVHAECPVCKKKNHYTIESKDVPEQNNILSPILASLCVRCNHEFRFVTGPITNFALCE